ncbi:MAG: carbohydrate kinase family protein [Desulfobulbaceae bacterium]|jgi:adenosine kinase|nr:carbohydrate kinase family protein [Desulfobulbaceae bacterium]
MSTKIIISGSMAYDRIMTFPDYFMNHIIPEKLHVLNVCFQIDNVTEHFGGTAGNIAYSLKLMGGEPLISAAIGRDYRRYFEWLAKQGVATGGIRIIDEEFTAGATITTDKADNQITGFNPGAMKHSSQLDFDRLDPAQTLMIVSPGNLDDMRLYPATCKMRGIRYIFDPGQSLPALSAADLLDAISGCAVLMVNDYEFELIMNKTGLNKEAIFERVNEATIITMGEHGSQVMANGRMTAIPVAKSKAVVDPTGCGDAYRGAFLQALASGRDILEAAAMGSVCASFAVEQHGTQNHNFSENEFRDRLRQFATA